MAERSRVPLHGTEVCGSNPAGSHQFLKPGPIDLKLGPIDFKDPPHLEEMESRERRWEAEKGDGKQKFDSLTS